MLAIGFLNAGAWLQAECGDHVVTRQQRELLASLSGDTALPAPVTPCHGPGCRGTPSDMPAPATPLELDLGGKLVASFAEGFDLPASDGWVAFRMLSDRPLDGFCAVIFRPPRPAAA